MARGTMHAQKPEGQRRRRNAPSGGPERIFVRDGEVHGPSIEDATFADHWSEPVAAWWETWRRAPQAVAFEDTDWQRLADLAPLRELLTLDLSPAERVKILGEIRMNEERLGATYTDRQRARIRITDEESAPDLATVTPISAARSAWDAEGEEDD